MLKIIHFHGFKDLFMVQILALMTQKTPTNDVIFNLIIHFGNMLGM